MRCSGWPSLEEMREMWGEGGGGVEMQCGK